MSFTACSNSESLRAQKCELPQVSIPIKHGGRFAKNFGTWTLLLHEVITLTLPLWHN